MDETTHAWAPLDPLPQRDAHRAGVEPAFRPFRGLHDLRPEECGNEVWRTPQRRKILADFCEAPQQILWSVVSGRLIGSERTRLVSDLAADLAKQGWNVGFLRTHPSDETRVWLTNGHLHKVPLRSTLVLFEHLEPFVQEVQTFLGKLADLEKVISPECRVRLLFLEPHLVSAGEAPETMFTCLVRRVSRSYLLHTLPERRTLADRAMLDRELSRPHPQSAPFKYSSWSAIGTAQGLPREDWAAVVRDVLARSRDPHAEEAVRGWPAEADPQIEKRVAFLTINGRPLLLKLLGVCLAGEPRWLSQLRPGQFRPNVLLDEAWHQERELRWPKLFERTPSIAELQRLEEAFGFSALAGGQLQPGDAEVIWPTTLKPETADFVLNQLLPAVLGQIASELTSKSRTSQLAPLLLRAWLLLRLAAEARLDPRAWLAAAWPRDWQAVLRILRVLVEEFPTARETSRWVLALLQTLHSGRWLSTRPAVETRGIMYAISRIVVLLAARGSPSDWALRSTFLELARSSEPAWLGAITAFFHDDLDDLRARYFSTNRAAEDRLFSWQQALITVPFAQRQQSVVLHAGLLATGLSRAAAHRLWQRVAAWGRQLRRLAGRNRENLLVQQLLACGQVETMENLARMEQWDMLFAWAEQLFDLAWQHLSDPLISLVAREFLAERIVGLDWSAERKDVRANEDLRLVWKFRLDRLREPDLRTARGQEVVVRYARTMVERFGNKRQWKKLEGEAQALRIACELYPEQLGLQEGFARVAVLALRNYARAKVWDSVESWGAQLRRIVKLLPKNRVILECLAQAARFAMEHYGVAQRLEDLEAWGERLTQLAHARPLNHAIQRAFAAGMSQAISSYLVLQQQDPLRAWSVRLTNLAHVFSDDPGVQFWTARAMALRLDASAERGDWPEVAYWGEILQRTTQFSHATLRHFVLLAAGAARAVHWSRQAQRWDECARWSQVLRDVAERFPEHAAIWSWVEVAAPDDRQTFESLRACGRARDWPAFEAEAAQVLAQAEREPDNPAPAARVAELAHLAVQEYGAHTLWGPLETWGERLLALEKSFPENEEIRFWSAAAVCVAMRWYSRAGRWAELEQWGERLLRARDDWPEDSAIRNIFADGAAFAAARYANKDRHAAFEVWYARLDDLARRFPTESRVQSALSDARLAGLRRAAAHDDPATIPAYEALLRATAEAPLLAGEHLDAFASAAVTIVARAASQRGWSALEEWAQRVFKLADTYPEHARLQQAQLDVSDLAGAAYESAGLPQKSRPWRERARALEQARAEREGYSREM